MSAELREFVRDALARGESRESLRGVLATAGWPPDEVESELARWADVAYAVPVPLPLRRTSLSAREAFLYLVLFATLYVAAFHTGAVLFHLVERLLPDPAMSRWRYQGADEALRWAVASLVIALPVFLYTNRLIGRALRREPGKRASGVRRWLTYLTLFVAALVLIGDFVAIVRGLLSGELVPRFLLKCAVVFSIAGIAFRHYLSDLRRDEVDAPSPRVPRAWLGRVGAVGMALTAIAGLLVAGAPQSARLRLLDQRRVGALMRLSREIDAWHGRNAGLPASLSDLVSSPRAGLQPEDIRDPATGMVYGYEAPGRDAYTLCATFARADSLDESGGVSAFWRHPAGRHCYELRISGKDTPEVP